MIGFQPPHLPRGSQDLVFIQEWLVKKYAKNIVEYRTNDEGRTEEEMKARFRTRLQDNLCFALVKGNALMAKQAGW